MNSYLDLLKNKNCRGGYLRNQNNPQPDSSLGSLGSTPTHSEKIDGETRRQWLLHFKDRESIAVTCTPGLTHAEILGKYPAAIAAEPVADPVPADLHIGERMEIGRWLKSIGEDAAGIATILAGIEQDAGAKAYYLRRAREGRAAA